MSNKTSDKNVANIEDDVKYVKEMLEIARIFFKAVKAETDYKNVDEIAFCNAIENILAEREQKDKRIKELKEERQLVGIPVRNKRDGNIGIVLHQWENGSIAVLERINPRIINTHDSWNTLEIITDEVKQIQTQENSIPTQRVENKIEELKEVRKIALERKMMSSVESFEIAIGHLQELLEGRNENG